MPMVRMVTDPGDLVVLLKVERAPASVDSFLHHVDAGDYDGGSFWRTVLRGADQGEGNIEIIQAAAAKPRIEALAPFEPTGVTGLRHCDGAIALRAVTPSWMPCANTLGPSPVSALYR